MNHRNLNWKSFGILIALIAFGLIVSHGAALYVIEDANDPYATTCPFDAAPGEEILYLNDYDNSDQGMQGITVDTDNPLTIGQYIRDEYPGIWNLLSPADRELYNTRWAVWHIGKPAPELPTKVKNLVASHEVVENLMFSQYQDPGMHMISDEAVTTGKMVENVDSTVISYVGDGSEPADQLTPSIFEEMRSWPGSTDRPSYVLELPGADGSRYYQIYAGLSCYREIPASSIAALAEGDCPFAVKDIVSPLGLSGSSTVENALLRHLAASQSMIWV